MASDSGQYSASSPPKKKHTKFLGVLVHHDQIAKASACRPARDLAHLKSLPFGSPMELRTREYTHELLAKLVAYTRSPLLRSD